MARSISRLVLVAACIVGLAGCGTGVAGDPAAGRPGRSPIQPGIYSGTRAGTRRTEFSTGESSVESYSFEDTLIVDSDGLLVIGGQSTQVGQQSTLALGGALSMTIFYRAVNVEQGALVITGDVTRSDGLVGGFMTAILEPDGPGAVYYTLTSVIGSPGNFSITSHDEGRLQER